MHLQDRSLRGFELLLAPVSVGTERHGVRVAGARRGGARHGPDHLLHLAEEGARGGGDHLAARD